MSDQIVRQYPFMSPDGLRQKVHIDKAFFDSHTKKQFGYEYADGTKYVGTVENYGAEQLLETRKMRTNRPPLGDVLLNNVFREYFEIKYDDNINMYSQHNAIMCLLKGNVLSTRTTYLIFQNVTRVLLVRATSSSDANMVAQYAYKTTTPPILRCQLESGGYEQFPLVAKDEANGNVTYWFNNTSMDSSTTPTTRMLLDPDHCSDGVIQTVPLEEWMDGIPFVWLTFSDRTIYPDPEFQNNLDRNGNTILTIGSDGHDHHYLFLYAHGENNLPSSSLTPPAADSPAWQVRIYSRHKMFVENDAEHTNQNQEISKIRFVHYTRDDPFTSEHHLEHFDITFNTRNVKLRLLEELGRYRASEWNYHKPVDGDWDYDGVTYKNEVYGYLNLAYHASDAFHSPFLELIPNQTVWMDYDWKCVDIRKGIHVDDTSDQSWHGVIKKNGSILKLGDFDGLPNYYKFFFPRTVNRAHVELYAIRDLVKKKTQHAMDKITAALLVDSGIPQTALKEIEDDMEIVLSYFHPRTYKKNENPILSIYNTLSSIGFVSRTLFGDVSISKYESCKKFVYHGKRTFSLGLSGLDPELETGRVYYLSGDGIGYENNALLTMPRPPRTMARICDIPTNMEQLISIPNKAPTIAVDPNYVRSYASYTQEAQAKILQLSNDGIWVYDGTCRRVFESSDDISEIMPLDYLNAHYPGMTNLNKTLTMKNFIHTDEIDGFKTYTWTIADAGVNYKMGDVIRVYLGGHIIRGRVSINASRQVERIEYLDAINEQETINVPFVNFDAQEMTVSAMSETGVGDNLKLTFRIGNGIWSGKDPKTEGTLPNIYTLKKDPYGNLWLWYYDDELIHEGNTTRVRGWRESTQLTGAPFVLNDYDIATTRVYRSVRACLLRSYERNIIQLTTNDDAINGASCMYQTKMLKLVRNLNVVSVYELKIENEVENYQLIFTYTEEDATKTFTDDEFEKYAILVLKTFCCQENTFYTLYYDENDRNILWIDYCSMGAYNTTVTRQIVYPRNHKLKQLNGISKVTNLLTTALHDGIDEEDYFIYQPKLYMFSPYLSTVSEYLYYSTDLVQTISKNPLTYEDLDYSLTEKMGLITYLQKDVFANNDYVFRYDTNECVYHPNIYDNNSIQYYQTKGAIVKNTTNQGDYSVFGPQPYGGLLPISTRVYPSAYTDITRTQHYTTELLYFFKIPDDEVASLARLRIYDEYSEQDVSENSIVLFKNELYIYDRSDNVWVAVTRKTTI